MSNKPKQFAYDTRAIAADSISAVYKRIRTIEWLGFSEGKISNIWKTMGKFVVLVLAMIFSMLLGIFSRETEIQRTFGTKDEEDIWTLCKLSVDWSRF